MAQVPKGPSDAELWKLAITTILYIIALWLIIDRRVNLIGDVIGILIILAIKYVFD